MIRAARAAKPDPRPLVGEIVIPASWAGRVKGSALGRHPRFRAVSRKRSPCCDRMRWGVCKVAVRRSAYGAAW